MYVSCHVITQSFNTSHICSNNSSLVPVRTAPLRISQLKTSHVNNSISQLSTSQVKTSPLNTLPVKISTFQVRTSPVLTSTTSHVDTSTSLFFILSTTSTYSPFNISSK
ncbi:hypothetical protein J6V86_00100 [bacterium]|nr:hypothetical protein [bacterium]